MRLQKSDCEVRSLDDWRRSAPPKKRRLHWKDGRSAKELARSWLRLGYPAPPLELVDILETTFGSGIVFESAEPECVVRLDNFRGEQRNCDLVVRCSVGPRPIVISIEAKADESFGDCYVGDYYDRKLGTRSNIPKRIERLSKQLFGRDLDNDIRELRYQLLHSSVAALIAAKKQSAACAVLLVHEFLSECLDRKNWTETQLTGTPS
jgi:hypothetical protein